MKLSRNLYFPITVSKNFLLFKYIFKGPDYDVDSGALFAQHKFQAQNKHPGKVIYPHFTTATDTSNVQVVFQVVMDTIVRENLKTATLL